MKSELARKPARNRTVEWLAVAAFLPLLLFICDVRVPMAICLAILLVLWLVARSLAPRIVPLLVTCSLYALYANPLLLTESASPLAISSWVMQRSNLYVLVLLHLGMLLHFLVSRSGSVEEGPAGSHPSGQTTSPPGLMLLVFALGGSVVILVLFWVLVRSGNQAWIRVRPVGHCLVVLMPVTIFISAGLSRIVDSKYHIRLDTFFMGVGLPAMLVYPLAMGVAHMAGLQSEAALQERIRASTERQGLQGCMLVTDLSESLECVENFLDSRPDDSEARVYEAVLLRALGKEDRARKAFAMIQKPEPAEEWLRIDPVFPEVACLAVEGLLEGRKNDLAVRLAGWGAEHYAESETLRFLRVRALLAGGEGGGQVEQALRTLPESAEAMYLRGIALENSGDVGGAVEFYRRATTRLPGHLAAWQALAGLSSMGAADLSSAESRSVRMREESLESLIGSGGCVPGRAEVLGVTTEQARWESPGRAVIESGADSGVLVRAVVRFLARGSVRFRGVKLKGGTWLEPTLDVKVQGPTEGERGEVREIGFLAVLPESLPSGDYSSSLELDFEGSEVSRLLPGPFRCTLTTWRVLPTLRPNPAARWQIEKVSGDESFWDLGHKVSLGPGQEIRIPVQEARTAGGCLLVSCLTCSRGLREGQSVGQLLLDVGRGEPLEFPIRYGIETADVYAEKHSQGSGTGKVKTWDSYTARDGEREFQAHRYYAEWTLPRKETIRGVVVRLEKKKDMFLTVTHVVLLDTDG